MPHKIQATAIGILPKFIDKSIIDSVEDITFEEAEELRRYLAKKESLFVGISSGANIAVAIRISKLLNNSQNIVTIAPDSGRSYL
ncbi:pyridoxal-phosphate dependent enzyme [Campylobacter fetus]|nr:pyridoxal-phosphate dependent enzyme [Campylobacter fetus]